MTQLVDLFKPYQINESLVPFALTFATGNKFSAFNLRYPIFFSDKIAEIRTVSINLVAEILAKFIKHEHSACRRSGLSIDTPNAMPLSDKFLEEIQNGFWKTKNWRRRQTFAIMMKVLLEKELISRKRFCCIFKSNLVEISLDGKSSWSLCTLDHEKFSVTIPAK